MSTPQPPGAERALSDAIDQALGRALRAAPLPEGFAARVQAALTNPNLRSAAERRSALHQEGQAALVELDSGYLQLRRRTLGTLIGVAFTAGTGIALALPWIRATFGPNAIAVVPALGAAVGLSMAVAAWLRRFGLPQGLR